MTTRLALHALAQQVISPVRVQATGNEIALQPRPGGFGTPDLPRGGWIGITGTELIRVDAKGAEVRFPITTLRAAATWAGLADADRLPDDPLELDPEASVAIAEAFARGQTALELLAADAGPGDDVSGINLWPEHFDLAVELGPEGTRATYGVSPGDDHHDDPYAYMAPWTPPPPDPVWNATGFHGAEGPVGDAAELLTFWRDRRAALHRT